jgi:phosphoglycolate phosphatase
LPITNIIFDFDGTLADSRRDIAGAQLWVLGQLGVDGFREEDLYPHIGKTLEETFERVLPATMHHRIAHAARMYSEYYPQRSLLTTRLFPGVRETLEILRSGGTKMAVASTKRGAGIRRATEHFGITGLFAQLQGSDGIPYKPDPFIINKIIGDQRWDRRATIMVGDTDNDVKAGKNAGIATCAVTYGSFSREELRPHTPDFIIDGFPALLAVVAQGPHLLPPEVP